MGIGDRSAGMEKDTLRRLRHLAERWEAVLFLGQWNPQEGQEKPFVVML
ncbi:MAG: hypothetical protein ACUVR9_00880 [Desulfosoma sp.]